MRMYQLAVVLGAFVFATCGDTSITNIVGPTGTPDTPSESPTPTPPTPAGPVPSPTPVPTPTPPPPAPTPPPATADQFSQGMVSITIDDGWRSTYNNAIPTLDAAGLKSTNYIITTRMNHPDTVGPSEILGMENRGHEIGSHTRRHMDLTVMTPADLTSEVAGSREDLLKIGVRSVMTFAYPFGTSNANVIQAVQSSGMRGARATSGGFNIPSGNRYTLSRHNLGGDVTLDQVKSWIDQAVERRAWLVFVAHHIDDTTGPYSITPSLFRGIVNYLVEKKVMVVTVSEGISKML